MQNSDKILYNQAESSVIESGETRTWGQIAYLLDFVEQRGLWVQVASSYTNWVYYLSKRLNVSESTLWRYQNAGRFYNTLRTVTLVGEEKLPILEVTDKISPEKLELLMKLSRVVPTDKYKELTIKVLNGTAKRSELRSAWEIYKGVLAGKTARGRGVLPPRIDTQNRSSNKKLDEAMTLNAILVNGPAWTGVNFPLLFDIFFRASIPSVDAKGKDIEIDSVIALKADKASPLEFHGITFNVSNR